MIFRKPSVAWALAVTAAAVIVLTAMMSDRAQRRAAVLGEVVTILSSNIPTVHVWLEEAIAGDTTINVERDVFEPIRRVKATTQRCAAALSGKVADDTRAVGERVVELDRRAHDRFASRNSGAQIASDDDQEFDAVYNDILARTGALHATWNDAEARQLGWLRALVAEVFVCALLAAALAVRATRLSRAITEQNAKLEERTEAARMAMAMAEDASRAKGEFLASMSHEIRTPLNAVIGFAEVLSQSKLDAQQTQYIGMLQAAGELLLDLVNDVLDFSKIEARHVELERAPFTLLDAVEDAVDLVAPLARKKKIELAVVVGASVPRVVVGDRVRFRQVVLNLVANAVKFTDRGEVLVRVEAAQPQDGDQIKTRVTVHDTGTGIPEDRLDRLFRPFQQADTSITRLRGGTGLGLTISKQLAELMGGTLSVKSRVGVGSDFTFELTFDVERDSEAPVSSGTHTSRALIVDDHEASRVVIRHHLADIGIEGVCASDAAAAHVQAKDAEDRRFEMIVLDQHIGAVLGSDLARELQEYPSTRGRPILLLTSEAGSPNGAGDNGLIGATLLKPVRRVRLVEVVNALLRRSGARMPIASAPRAPAVRSEVKVLVVDDHEVNIELARALFATVGVTVIAADSAREALVMVEEQAFDLVLLDLHMPEMDGISCARIMKKQLGERCPRLVALTADATDRAREGCLEVGFERVLTKPIRSTELATLFATASSDGDESDRDADRDLDPANLELLLSYDNARGRRTAAMFITTSREREITLRESCASRDFVGVLEQAHGLRGAAGVIGARRLYEALKQLEAVADKQKSDELDTAFAAVCAAGARAQKAVAEWLETRAETQPPSTSE